MAHDTNFSSPASRHQITTLQKAMQQPAPLSYNVAGAIAATGLGRSTIFAMLADGRLERVKVGKRTLIPRASLERLLNGEAA